MKTSPSTEPSSETVLHPVQASVEQLLKECRIQRTKRGGPGGQHRNKTDSAVVVCHSPTGVEGQASERRSQVDNQRNALKRLRINLALQVRTAALADAAPTPLWRSRCVDERIVCNPGHEDFAPLLAEALDVLHARNGHLPGSAQQLGVTPSQLVKFLKHEPRAIQLVNDDRRRRNLSPLE